jgi:predicted CXXCH cytochrome family protein
VRRRAKSLLSLLSIIGILLGSSSWAVPPYDEVVRTPHNLLPSQDKAGFKNICLSCHTDGQVFKEQEDHFGSEALASNPETPADLSPSTPVLPEPPPGPLWSARNKGQAFFSLASSLWRMETNTGRKPFGSSSACLTCHDGALALDVHGEGKVPGEPKTARDRSLDHPTAIPYPRQPDGIFATERPTPGSQRYWSIADRTGEGVVMPSGPVSSYFRLPDGMDPKDPAIGVMVVRTSYGIIHCDSCHNPHVNTYPPFLRTLPKDLCFVCHDR